MTSDAYARQRALDFKTSFICEAPAGSGKTELLTQRVLTLLARVDVPESVLAITFTRKAAAEMQARVLSALVSAKADAPEDEHKKNTWVLASAVLKADEKHGWNLLLNPSRLNIKTFDGLSRSLMQALPLQAAIDVQWSPSDEPEALYKEAAQDVLDTLEKDVPWAGALKKLFRHLDNRYDTFERLLVGMLQNRDAWMPVLGVQHSSEMAENQSLRHLLEQFLELTVYDNVEALSAAIPPSQMELMLRLCDFAGANVYRVKPESTIANLRTIPIDALPGADDNGIVLWQSIAELFLTKDNKSWRKRLTKNEGFPPGEGKEEKAAFKLKKEEMLELLGVFGENSELFEMMSGIRTWPSIHYSDAQWSVLNALTQVLPVAVVHLHWVFRRQQAVDFTEVSQRARAALGEEESPTDLALRLDHSISHILVDEFQDTSFTQVDLLKKLTYGWVSGDGRTVFCVGDAMQSIYSFRAANVGLFLHCKYAGLGQIPLESLQFTANFRSQAGIVEWVNKTFSKAFPSRVDIPVGAVPYSLAEPFRAKADDSASVSMHVFPPGNSQAGATWLVNTLKDLWTQKPDATVGVLVKSRNHAAEIVNALEQAQMKYRALDMVPLKAREVIQDVLTLTHALLFLGNRIAWLSVLRAPWCGLTLKDLTIIAAQGRQQTVLQQMTLALSMYERYTSGAQCVATSGVQVNDEEAPLAPPLELLSPDGYKRLLRVYKVLNVAVGQRQRKSLVAYVEGVWRALGGAYMLDDAGDKTNIERYWQLLEGFDQKGVSPTAEGLERAVDSLYAAPDPKASGQLQIMTIHKSKGLEFDAVFLPELQRGAPQNDAELLLWHERLSAHGEETVLFAPISPVGQGKDAIYTHLDAEKKKRLKLETCRLLYVACTRARERLYLMATLDENDPESAKAVELGRFKPPKKDSLLSYIWPSVSLTAQAMSDENDVCAGDNPHGADFIAGELKWGEFKEDEPKNILKRVKTDWAPNEVLPSNVLADYIIHHQYDNQSLPEFLQSGFASQLPRHVGTVVHEAAQSFAEGFQVKRYSLNGVDEYVQFMMPAWRARLSFLGVSPPDLEAGLATVTQLVIQLLGHPKFEWMLQQPQSFYEFPVTVARGAKSGSALQSRTINYILDALIITDSGEAWIVDYKTSTPEVGESVESFLAREQASYAQILKAYRGAIQKMGYSNVFSVLFFVATGSWLVVQ